MCLCLCGSVTTTTRNFVHRLHQTGSVGAGSDHLQLIKFWPSCIPEKGVCDGAKIFGSALLRPARSVCVSIYERFFFSLAPCICMWAWPLTRVDGIGMRTVVYSRQYANNCSVTERVRKNNNYYCYY